jgi:hypothetical protein
MAESEKASNSLSNSPPLFTKQIKSTSPKLMVSAVSNPLIMPAISLCRSAGVSQPSVCATWIMRVRIGGSAPRAKVM